MWVTSLFLPEPPGKYGNFLPRVQMETGPPRHEGTRPGPCGLDGASPGFRELCTLCCRGPWFPVFPCVSCIHPCYPFPCNVSSPPPTFCFPCHRLGSDLPFSPGSKTIQRLRGWLGRGWGSPVHRSTWS